MSAEAATALLNSLLDRIEVQPLEERTHAVTARVPERATSGDHLQALVEVLRTAERAGTVDIVYGRGETRHLIQSVRLRDPAALYRQLGRRPATELAQEAVTALLVEFGSASPEVLSTICELEEGWGKARAPYGLRPGGAQTRAFLAALGAVLGRAPEKRLDLRTLSSRTVMDSKTIERQAPRIVEWMTARGRLPPGLSQNEAQAALGLEKFAHPVLMAGQFTIRSTPVAPLAYVGVAPDDIEFIEVVPGTQALLTIENFASFNRHVSEAMTGREVVAYTGGFPSRVVLRALRRLVPMFDGGVWHWGDIDGGGVRIAQHLANEVAPCLRLHLMTAELAVARGRPAPADPTLTGLAATPELTLLAGFLASAQAHHLEQEALDPLPVVSLKEQAGCSS